MNEMFLIFITMPEVAVCYHSLQLQKAQQKLLQQYQRKLSTGSVCIQALHAFCDHSPLASKTLLLGGYSRGHLTLFLSRKPLGLYKILQPAFICLWTRLDAC